MKEVYRESYLDIILCQGFPQLLNLDLSHQVVSQNFKLFSSYLRPEYCFNACFKSRAIV